MEYLVEPVERQPIRKTLVLNHASGDRMKYIRRAAEYTTDQDAVRLALRVTAELMSLQLEGYEIQIRHPKTNKEIRFERLPAAPAAATG